LMEIDQIMHMKIVELYVLIAIHTLLKEGKSMGIRNFGFKLYYSLSSFYFE